MNREQASRGVRPPRAALENLRAYDPREVEAEIILSANENSNNMPPELEERIADHLARFKFNRYPDATATRLRALIAEANGLDSDNVIIGNGGDELLMNLFLAWGGPGRTLLTFPPTFAMYENDAIVTGTTIVEIPRKEDFSLPQEETLARVARGDIDMVIIANPNNPTGNLEDEGFLIELLKATDALVLIDEAYFEFSRSTMRPLLERFTNLVILRTFSKAFSLAALRVGYLLAQPSVIHELLKVRQPYSVSAFSQWAAQVVYRNRMLFEQGIENIVSERNRLTYELSKIPGVTVFPSSANYLLFKVSHASGVWRDLVHSYGIRIRDVSRGEGLEDCLRVTVGSREQNDAFIAALLDIQKRSGQ